MSNTMTANMKKEGIYRTMRLQKKTKTDRYLDLVTFLMDFKRKTG